MTKFYNVYTQIPGIKPCPQMWIVADEKMNIIEQLLHERNFLEIRNIVGTTVKQLPDTKTLVCRQKYFICIVEQYVGDDK